MPVISNATKRTVQPRPARIFCDFRQEPFTSKRLGGAATGTAGDRNVLLVPNASDAAAGFEWVVKGTQTILAPSLGTNGLDIGMDQTSGDGLELHNGLTARCPVALTVGTHSGFVSAKVKIEDVSGCVDLFVGWRKAAAFAADMNDYTDFAVIGCAAGDIKTATALNNAATVLTDTTDNWADAAEKRLTVAVSRAGVVSYQVDEAAPTTVVAYTFDSADVLIPFLVFAHGADVAGTVELTEWNVERF